jgi:hypothetical protein
MEKILVQILAQYGLRVQLVIEGSLTVDAITAQANIDLDKAILRLWLCPIQFPRQVLCTKPAHAGSFSDVVNVWEFYSL